MLNVERHFYSMNEVHEMTGLSKSYLFQLANLGVLVRMHAGRKALFTAESVRRLIEFGYPSKAKPKKGRPEKERPVAETLDTQTDKLPTG